MRDLQQDAPTGTHKFVVARAGVLQETYKHISGLEERVLKLKFQIEYKGEPGIDSGGLSKVAKPLQCSPSSVIHIPPSVRIGSC